MATTGVIEVELSGLGAGWTALTSDLTDLMIRARRGFQTNAPDDLVAAPPTLTFALDNSSHNTGGVVGYYSLDSVSKRAGWAEGIGVRLRVTANGSTRTRFYGWIETITVTTGTYEDHTVTVTALGWMAEAATAPYVSLSTQIGKRDDELVTSLVALVPRQPPATSYATGLEAFPYALDDLRTTDSDVLNGLVNTVRSGFSRLFEKADGTLVLENRSTRQTYATDLVTLTDVAAGATPGLALTAMPVDRKRSRIINRVLVTVHPKRVDAAAVVLYAVQTTGSNLTIAPMSTVTFNGVFADPNQQAQSIGAFNTLIDNGSGGSMVGTSGNLPAADFDFGSAQGLTDLSTSCTVTVAYTATDVIFTVTNNSGTQTAFVTKLQCRGQGLYDYQPINGTALDTASRTAYGQRAITIDCPYQADPFFAQSGADYCLRQRAVSVTTLEDGIEAFVHAGDEVSMDTLLQRDISDPIGIAEGVSGITAGKYWINAVEEAYDERWNATFRFYLTPRDAQPAWAWGIAGQSEWGTTTYYGF